MKHKYYLGLGTNLGNREEFLAAARRELNCHGEIVASSRITETEPFGSADAPFLNQVIEFHSTMEPSGLLDTIKQLEKSIGRQPRAHWGNREIDIDILLWDKEKLDTVTPQGYNLIIPHPGLPDRPFLQTALREMNHPYELN